MGTISEEQILEQYSYLVQIIDRMIHDCRALLKLHHHKPIT